MRFQTTLIDSKEQSQPQFHLRRVQKILLPSDHETTSRQILPRRSALTHLFRIHIPHTRHDLGVPGLGSTQGVLGSFVQGTAGDLMTGVVVSEHSTGRTVIIGMEVQVVFSEVFFDQKLVLLLVAAAEHQVVLTSDEPVELLEPEGFSVVDHIHFPSGLDSNLGLQVLALLDVTVQSFQGLFLLLSVFFLLLIITLGILSSFLTEVDTHWDQVPILVLRVFQ
jgi:hypothetical protein